MSFLKHLEEFEERLGALDRDSRQAAVFAYTEFTFHHVEVPTSASQDRLNQHDPSACGLEHRHGPPRVGFVALGRMFDDDRSTYNIEGLLRYAEGKMEYSSPGYSVAGAPGARRHGSRPQ